jgi:hypothetical protein
MTTDDFFEEIKKQLKHPFIRIRRAAINNLAERLQDPAYRKEGIKLLEESARKEKASILRELAQAHLDEDTRRYPEFHPGEGKEHIIGVKCPSCHGTTYFDKRVVCTEKSYFYRKLRIEGKTTFKELLLTCEHCGEKMIIRIDCEGYS